MYNREIKEWFMDGYAKSQSVRESCLLTFEGIAPFEERLGKDVYKMSSDESRAIIEEVGGVRSENGRVHIIQCYVRWAVAHHIPGAKDGFLRADGVSFEKLRSKMVSGPLHLQKCLDEIFDREEDNTVHCTYRCFFWFAFMGIPEEETIKIKDDEVDLVDMVIRHELSSYPIYRESLRTIQRCIKLTEFNYFRKNTKNIYTTKRSDGRELMRGVRGVPSITNIRSTVTQKKRIQDANGQTCDISYNTVWLSGVFYRMYEQERAGITPDFAPVVRLQMSGKEYSQKGGHSASSRMKKLLQYYADDYQNWKNTFA